MDVRIFPKLCKDKALNARISKLAKRVKDTLEDMGVHPGMIDGFDGFRQDGYADYGFVVEAKNSIVGWILKERPYAWTFAYDMLTCEDGEGMEEFLNTQFGLVVKTDRTADYYKSEWSIGGNRKRRAPELELPVSYAVTVTDGERIWTQDIPQEIAGSEALKKMLSKKGCIPIDDLEKLITWMRTTSSWMISRTVRWLSITKRWPLTVR